ncbi:MAG: hypothetical protein Q4D34_03520 [Eggerthellaceae bacterium]|nr:hypothetical protein [Eggerthellaceae bacterium]
MVDPKDRKQTSEDLEDERRPHTRARVVNAVAACFIMLLFLVHACLGTLKLYWPDMPSSLEFIVWFGVAVIVFHVIASIVTTYEMWTDTVRPPSDRKKRHQVLKWVTGVLLACSIVVHQLCVAQLLPPAAVDTLTLPALIVTAILLCWHLFVGAKSLTRDLNLRGALRTPLRVMFIVITVVVCVAVFLLIMR